MTTATAHPNIALVKYWGKQARPGNLPVSPNLSITLSELETTTSVTDLDGEQVADNAAVFIEHNRVKNPANDVFAYLADEK